MEKQKHESVFNKIQYDVGKISVCALNFRIHSFRFGCPLASMSSTIWLKQTKLIRIISYELWGFHLMLKCVYAHCSIDGLAETNAKYIKRNHNLHERTARFCGKKDSINEKLPNRFTSSSRNLKHDHLFAKYILCIVKHTNATTTKWKIYLRAQTQTGAWVLRLRESQHHNQKLHSQVHFSSFRRRIFFTNISSMNIEWNK